MEAIKFTAHNDAELARLKCALENGNAILTVCGSNTGICKTGTPWLRIKFDAVDDKGNRGKAEKMFFMAGGSLKDYKDFCEAANQPGLYQKGSLDAEEEINGLTVQGEIEWEDGRFEGMKVIKFFRAQNSAEVLKDFYSAEQKKKEVAVAELPDDDIPF